MREPLPLELLRRIVGQLDPRQSSDRQALCRLSSVSEALQKLAHPLIWETLVVRDLREPSRRRLLRRRDNEELSTPKLERRKKREVIEQEVEQRKLEMRKDGWDDYEQEMELERVSKELCTKAAYDPDDGTHDWSGSDIFDNATHRQLVVLADRPDLAKLVKTVVFDGKYDGRAAAKALELCLQHLPAVERLELTRPSIPEEPVTSSPPHWHRPTEEEVRRRHDERLSNTFDAWPTLTAKVPHLRYLSLSHFLLDNLYPALQALEAFEQLEHLQLSVTDNRSSGNACQYPYFSASSFKPRYRLKTLDVSGDIDRHTFLAIATPHSDTLTSLSLPLLQYDHDLSGFTALTFLCITYSRHDILWSYLFRIPRTVLYLELRKTRHPGRDVLGYLPPPPLPRLDETSRDVYESDYHREASNRDNFDLLLEALPPSITRLSLPFFLSMNHSNPTPNLSEGEGPPVLAESTTLLKALNQRTKRGKGGLPTVAPALERLDLAFEPRLWSNAEVERRRRGERTAVDTPVVREWPEKLSWTAKRMLKQKADFGAACRKRGVVLTATSTEWHGGKWWLQ